MNTGRIVVPAKYPKVLAHYRHLIESGELPPGTRLPSIGEVADRWAVSRKVVQEVWHQLVLLGLIEERYKARAVVAYRPNKEANR